MATANLTPLEAIEFFAYEPATGIIRWRKQPPNTKRVACGAPAGYLAHSGYWRITFRGQPYYGHRIAWALVHGAWPTTMLDHINGDKADNRIANLRPADGATNQQNRRASRNKAGLLGVTPAGDRWRARIKRGGVLRSLGIFSTAADAHAAYVAAKRLIHPGGTL